MPSVGMHAYVRDRGHGGVVGGPGDGPGTAVKIAKGEMLCVLPYVTFTFRRQCILLIGVSFNFGLLVQKCMPYLVNDIL